MKNALIIQGKWFVLLGLSLSIFLLSSYRLVGYIGFAITLISTLHNSKKITIDKLFKASALCMIFIILRFLLQLAMGVWYDGTARSLLLQVFIYFYIIIIRNSTLELNDWRWILERYAFFILILSIYLLLTNQLVSSRLFSTMFGNMVLIGFGISFIMTQLHIDKRVSIFWIILTILFVYLTFESDMRSAVIGEIVAVAFALYTSLRNEGIRFNRIFFFVIIAGIFLVPYIYMELYQPSTEITRTISYTVQQKVLTVFHKRLFSGRNELWPHIFESLKGHQFIGNGVGFNPGQVYETLLSSHNLFLFIRLEQGFIGLLAFIYLIYTLWQDYYFQKVNKSRYFVQGFMVAILMQQTFSLGLIGGKGAFSIGCWTVFIALSNQHKPNQKELES